MSGLHSKAAIAVNARKCIAFIVIISLIVFKGYFSSSRKKPYCLEIIKKLE